MFRRDTLPLTASGAAPGRRGGDGVGPGPARQWSVARFVLLRTLGLCLAAGFLSLLHQAPGLVGSEGLTPLEDTFALYRAVGWDAVWRVPSLFWLSTDDHFVLAVAWTGLAASTALTLGFAPRWTALACYVLFHAFTSTEPVAMGPRWFNWPFDDLLVETTFLAVFLAPPGWWPRPGREPAVPAVARGLMVWLLVRLFLGPGVTKVLHPDPVWRSMEGTRAFLETGPNPMPLAAWVHELPDWLHLGTCALTLGIETVGVALLVFGRGHVRWIALLLTAAFMASLQLTSNLRGFNLLSLALLLLLVDDATLRAMAAAPGRALARLHGPRALALPAAPPAPGSARPAQPLDVRLCRRRRPGLVPLAAAAAYVLASLVPLSHNLGLAPPPALAPLASVATALRVANGYSMFAGVAPERRGLVVQARVEGRPGWSDYQPLGLPARPDVAPRMFAPYHDYLAFLLWWSSGAHGPRDDPRRDHPWLERLQAGLLAGHAPVRRLFADVPTARPLAVRIVRYRFRFADAASRAHGTWWIRDRPEVVVPPRTVP